nr:NAD(P)H-dependent oxidoreductase [Pseudopedobacter sp.]
MKVNDENAKLPADKRPYRILIISGSDRRQYNCPGVDSKSRTLMLKMAAMLPKNWEVDYEDLGNVYGRAQIRSCNACVSTSMALCVWPCNCYAKGSWREPDLMWDMDMYARFDMADAWAIIGPVNWYASSSNLKLMFDRLVCMNGGNPDERTIDHKDPEKAMALEHLEQWKEMSINHLEGRTAAFFCYGDEGGDEMDSTGRPKILRHENYFIPDQEPFSNMRDAYAPLVWQCRYGGIEVPDQLWLYCTTGKDQKYSDNQAEDMIEDNLFMKKFEVWVKNFENFTTAKGKVQPGKYRAFGYTPPTDLWKEAKTGIRSWMLRFGISPENSSPEKQKKLKLNKDTTLNPSTSEGENLRKNLH